MFFILLLRTCLSWGGFFSLLWSWGAAGSIGPVERPPFDGVGVVSDSESADGAREARMNEESPLERARRAFGGRDRWEALPAPERTRLVKLIEVFDASFAAGDEEAMIDGMRDYVRSGMRWRYRTATARDAATRLAAKGRTEEALEVLRLIGPQEPDAPGARLTEAQVLRQAGRTDEARAVLRDLRPPASKVRGNYSESRDLFEAARLMVQLGDHERARQFYVAARPADDAASRSRYLLNGQFVAVELKIVGGRSAEALNLMGTLLRKYPDAAGPQQLSFMNATARELASSASRGAESRSRYREIQERSFSLLADRFPESLQLHFDRLERVDDAVDAGEIPRAERELAAAASRFDRLTPLQRTDVRRRADRVREKGGRVPDVLAQPTPLAPVPDPAFGTKLLDGPFVPD